MKFFNTFLAVFLLIASPPAADASGKATLESHSFLKELPKQIAGLQLYINDRVGHTYMLDDDLSTFGPYVSVGPMRFYREAPDFNLPKACSISVDPKLTKQLECKFFVHTKIPNERGLFSKSQDNCNQSLSKSYSDVCIFQSWTIWNGREFLSAYSGARNHEEADRIFKAVTKKIFMIRRYQAISSESQQ